MTQTIPTASAKAPNRFWKNSAALSRNRNSRHGCCRFARPAWRASPNSAFPRFTTKTGASRTLRRSPNCRSSRRWNRRMTLPPEPRWRNTSLQHLPGSRLVFVNGHFQAALSSVGQLPDGVKVASLAAALATDSAFIEKQLGRFALTDNNSFAALNQAFFLDGGFVHIPANQTVAEPIQLIFISTAETQRRHDSAAQPDHCRGRQQGDGHRKLSGRGPGRLFHQCRHGNCRRRQRGAGAREIPG